jgi:hypothetical protein
MIVKLEIHEARHTPARTWWTIIYYERELSLEEAETKNIIRRVSDTAECGKTHWYVYYEVINPMIKFVMHRISNRGNYSKTIVEPKELETTEDVLIA